MIGVKVDTRSVSRMLSDIQRKQLPFAAAMALNDVAFNVQNAERAAFQSFFKNPRPFTSKSLLVTKATKSKLVSSVYVRPEVAAYLAPYEFGGAHVVPGTQQLVPVKMRLDQYGQITRTTLAKLNAMANDQASGVFYGEVHGIKGYWLRPRVRFDFAKAAKGNAQLKTRLQLIAQVEAPMQVTEHLDFIPNATNQVVKAWPEAIQRAVGKALATARP